MRGPGDRRLNRRAASSRSGSGIRRCGVVVRFRPAESGADQPNGVVGRVFARIVGEREVEQRAASPAREPHEPPRAGHGKQEVAPDVRFEIDGQIVSIARPSSRVLQQPGQRVTVATASQPARVEGFDAIDRRNGCGEVRVPAAHHEIDRRVRSQSPQLCERGQGHQQVADSFEPQAQDPTGSLRT